MAPLTERQRALVSQYKRTPKTMGVYCIRNVNTDRCFVAASRDVQARFNRHRLELKTKAERCSDALQQDWNEQGADAFEFTVLDELEPTTEPDYDPTEDLQVLEALWLEKLQPFVPAGYNPAPH